LPSTTLLDDGIRRAASERVAALGSASSGDRWCSRSSGWWQSAAAGSNCRYERSSPAFTSFTAARGISMLQRGAAGTLTAALKQNPAAPVG